MAEEESRFWTSRTFWVKTIVTTLVASAIAPFFQTILIWLSNIIVSSIGFFYNGYLDSLYYDAAQNPADSLIYIMFFLLAFAPMLLTVAAIMSMFIRPKTQETPKRVRYMFVAVTVVTIIPFLIAVAGPAVSIRANATFQRRLMALTPVISDAERKQLLGQWAMINSKASYQNINKQIEELATKYNAPLPKRAE
jgi:hypothetical protein